MRTFKGKNYAARLDLGKPLAGKMAAGIRGLEVAAIFLVGGYKQDISLPGPDPGTDTGKKRERRLQRIREAGDVQRASKKGEPPRKREGTLHDSITYEMVGATARVGSPLDYAYWLEWGTRFMDARPWARPGLARRVKQIAAIVIGMMRKG